MALRKNPPANAEPIDEAARKTGALIRDLQQRLTSAGEGQPGALMRELQSRVEQGDEKAGVLIQELDNLRQAAGRSATETDEPAPPETMPEETVEDLERQMMDYFESSAKPVAPVRDLRSRVLDEVVDRIMREWMREGGARPALEAEVFDRLVHRLMERMQPGAGKPPE